MKNITILACIILTFLIFSPSAYAEDAYYSQVIEDVLDWADDETESILGQLGLEQFTAEELSNISLSDISNLLFGIFKGSLKKPLHTLTTLTGLIIAFSVCSCYIQNSSLLMIFEGISVIFCSLTVLSDLMNSISDAVISLTSLSDLMKILVPVIAAIASFSGSPKLAVSYNAVTVYAAEIVSAVCTDFLTPVLMMFTVIAVCLTFNPTVKGDSILSAVKKGVNMILGFCSAIFTGISGIKNLLSSGADKISVKGVQFILGSSVPVVGGALSEGLSSIIAAVSLMKSTLGVVGIIITIVVVLPAACELILWSLSLSLASYVCSIFAQPKTESVIQAFKFSVSMMLSLILFCAYIFIVSTGMVILMGSK
ncbi:MAG: hypothetical protein IJZ35_04065 [Clostridia bacterium]|nr:hypothetical protein [Clostridia bacterium]